MNSINAKIVIDGENKVQTQISMLIDDNQVGWINYNKVQLKSLIAALRTAEKALAKHSKQTRRSKFSNPSV